MNSALFPGVSKNRSQRGNFFDFEITKLHTLRISYVEECGKKKIKFGSNQKLKVKFLTHFEV